MTCSHFWLWFHIIGKLKWEAHVGSKSFEHKEIAILRKKDYKPLVGRNAAKQNTCEALGSIDKTIFI